MHSNTDCLSLNDNIADCNVEQKHLHDVTTLAAEIKRLLVRSENSLKEGGVRKEMEQLEHWLEAERKGPAPACIVSESGIAWLTALRDRMKLSAEEAQRLESEGGNPSSKEQVEQTEQLLQAVRRIDKIIHGNTETKPH